MAGDAADPGHAPTDPEHAPTTPGHAPSSPDWFNWLETAVLTTWKLAYANSAKLDRLSAAVGKVQQTDQKILQGGIAMAGELDDLKTRVTQNGDVTQSAVTLLQGLKQKLDAAIANNDMPAIKALSDQLGQQDDALAAAVTANTPAAAGGGGGTAPAGGAAPRQPQPGAAKHKP